jgi:hypothetical protein
VALSAVEVIRVEHPGSQLNGSVVAGLRVIEVEVDVDLLWVAVGPLGRNVVGASWTPMLHIPSPSMTEWNVSSANICPLSIPAQNALSASRSAAFEHHHTPNPSHRSAPLHAGIRPSLEHSLESGSIVVHAGTRCRDG